MAAPAAEVDEDREDVSLSGSSLILRFKFDSLALLVDSLTDSDLLVLGFFVDLVASPPLPIAKLVLVAKSSLDFDFIIIIILLVRD